MNDYTHFDSSPAPHNDQVKLARWLQSVLATPSQEHTPLSPPQVSEQPGASPTSNYHLHFYQQLPDFIMALLRNDSQVTALYAPLMYHLLSCSDCHTAYLELYDAMRYAVQVGDTQPVVNQGTRPLSTIPVGNLVHLCQQIVSQAEAVLMQSHHDHSDEDTLARSLLQLAMRISAKITQSNARSRALRDLVHVATLFDGAHSPGEEQVAAHSYSALEGAGGTPRHGKVVRGVETAARMGGKPGESSTIYLQAQPLEGSITQQGDILELHLQDLDEKLRGHHLSISVPLGSLLEPVRWRGGNPRAIHTVAPVGKDGSLKTPLGQTDLRLTNSDERSLLEVMFLRLEVRSAD